VTSGLEWSGSIVSHPQPIYQILAGCKEPICISQPESYRPPIPEEDQTERSTSHVTWHGKETWPVELKMPLESSSPRPHHNHLAETGRVRHPDRFLGPKWSAGGWPRKIGGVWVAILDLRKASKRVTRYHSRASRINVIWRPSGWRVRAGPPALA